MDWNEVARNFVFTPHSNWTLNWHLLLDQIKNLCELSRMMFDINLEGPRLLDVEHNHCADNRHPTNSNWQLSYGRAHLQVGNLKLYFELVATLKLSKEIFTRSSELVRHCWPKSWMGGILKSVLLDLHLSHPILYSPIFLSLSW